MISEMDDYLIHQVAEPIRYTQTSDRNFYDRHYFNMHHCSSELFLVAGVGQYPNLGTLDAFVAVRLGDRQLVLRSSRELGDRADVSCGPVRVEILKGLERLRFVVEPNESGIEADLIFHGAHPPVEEPRQFDRRAARVLWDVIRYGQNGHYTGTLRAGGKSFGIGGGDWQGYRDRSWGVRPVGEREPAGIQKRILPNYVWLYCAAQFDTFSLMLKLQDNEDGARPFHEAVKVWNDPSRPIEHLGRIDYDLVLDNQARLVRGARIHCPDAPGGGLVVEVEQLLPLYLMAGTGYLDTDKDWRHGMYQGVLKTQYLEYDVGGAGPGIQSMIDAAARYRIGDEVGHGLFEYAIMGNCPRYGIEGRGFWNRSENPRQPTILTL